jgi:hypothetical protein
MNSLDEDFKTTLKDTHKTEIRALRAQANSFGLFKLLDGYTNSTAHKSTQALRTNGKKYDSAVTRLPHLPSVDS